MATDFGKELLMQMVIWNAEDMKGKCRVYWGSDALMSAAAIYCQIKREQKQF
jgi:hypothetical protein